ncbi:MAG: DUF4268 domain-containing protein [Candidatus Brocadia sp.]|nr:hypothetical protein [Candidatus Brocadia fulgida]MCC6326226.1 DUF4268 domain-containing protein [Candidatus Brocadia sp.]MCE7910902.1 DUF4268 domain-containing protein [Candidatus Brocadia sp. AMX3]MDG5996962.1 DUF4268 domain-containing protein [Candidatus Brocadia sp.]RIK00096.1 MAG: DUF4268 domain-containing protein [Candidatus Brocadia sp.]
MKVLSKLKRLNLREAWTKEAGDFTPWLADNIEYLGAALGMDLELKAREASIGDFSLDLLAKDLGSGRTVVIENQLTQTDHDHLGKLLTYAAGFGASVVIWVAETIREEHRQALEWLNQRTDTDTEFFGVVVELLQIDDSKPAYNFKPVVFPNEWQKTKRSQTTGRVSTKGEAYRQYYQPLIDELREKHKFTGARIAQPQSWYAFSAGTSGVPVSAVFAGDGTARVELYIDLGTVEANKALFDWLQNQKDSIEKQLGFSLQWERLDGKRASRIYVSRSGSIESTAEELEQLRKWQIEKLLHFKKILAPLVKAGVKQASA